MAYHVRRIAEVVFTSSIGNITIYLVGGLLTGAGARQQSGIDSEVVGGGDSSTKRNYFFT